MAVDFILQFYENEIRDLILVFSNLIHGIKNPRKFRKNFEDWAEIIQKHQKSIKVDFAKIVMYNKWLNTAEYSHGPKKFYCTPKPRERVRRRPLPVEDKGSRSKRRARFVAR